MVGAVIFLVEIFLLTAAGIIGYYFLIKFSEQRKALSVVKGKPRRLKMLNTTRTPKTVINDIVQFAQGSRYLIEDIDESKGRLILSSPFNHLTWGFFYPIYISSQLNENTLVEVGIQSKLYQIGPLVWKDHQRIFDSIKRAVGEN
ncbi:MAG: hypothetical protein ACFFB5_18445 [Promethearchaeota archaeon]